MMPVVGDVILDKIFSSVDLPEPLQPITPKISPCFISRFILLSAHILSVSLSIFLLLLNQGELGSTLLVSLAKAEEISRLSILVEILPNWYCLDRFFISIMVSFIRYQ